MADCPVAIITGGVQGLGAAICFELLKKSYRVCIADIKKVEGEKFVKEQQKIHGQEKLIFCHCDATKEYDYQRLFETTLKQFNRVDVLFNNAGIIMEQDPRKTLDVNLMGPIIGCQTALKYMGKSNGGSGGIVINTASLAGFLPFSSMPVYIASKHGVIGLTRSYGCPAHFDKDGVMFMAFGPSFTRTPLLHSVANTLIHDLDFSKRKGLMNPEYVAKGVMKLLEDKINGSTLVITNQGYDYIGYQEELKHLMAEEFEE